MGSGLAQEPVIPKEQPASPAYAAQPGFRLIPVRTTEHIIPASIGSTIDVSPLLKLTILKGFLMLILTSPTHQANYEVGIREQVHGGGQKIL